MQSCSVSRMQQGAFVSVSYLVRHLRAQQRRFLLTTATPAQRSTGKSAWCGVIGVRSTAAAFADCQGQPGPQIFDLPPRYKPCLSALLFLGTPTCFSLFPSPIAVSVPFAVRLPSSRLAGIADLMPGSPHQLSTALLIIMPVQSRMSSPPAEPGRFLPCFAWRALLSLP